MILQALQALQRTFTPASASRGLHIKHSSMGISNIIRYEHEHEQEIQNADPNLMQGKQPFSPLSPPDNETPFTLHKDSSIHDILQANKNATDRLRSANPEVLEKSGKGQSPHTLWIGCSDSRVNEYTALGCYPGEIFTLRNIANLISYQDFSSMSALQFAIDILKVQRVVVCGHTDCGGVWASLSSKKVGGVLDNWLSPIRQIRAQNIGLLKSIEEPFERCTTLSELNILNSIDQIRKHPSFVNAYKTRGIELYAMIYDVKTGYLRELEVPDNFDNDDDFHDVFHLSEEAADNNPH